MGKRQKIPKPKPKVNKSVDGQVSGGRKLIYTFLDPPRK